MYIRQRHLLKAGNQNFVKGVNVLYKGVKADRATARNAE